MAIQEPDYVWMDGKYVNWKDANVPILTHAMHYGTAVFEGIRAYPSEDNLLVFRLKEHLERLVESCKILPLEHKFSVDDLEKAIYDPRIHLEGADLHLEPEIIKTLDIKGINNIRINEFSDINLFFGGVNAVSRNEAVADPRRGGFSLVC